MIFLNRSELLLKVGQLDFQRRTFSSPISLISDLTLICLIRITSDWDNFLRKNYHSSDVLMSYIFSDIISSGWRVWFLLNKLAVRLWGKKCYSYSCDNPQVDTSVEAYFAFAHKSVIPSRDRQLLKVLFSFSFIFPASALCKLLRFWQMPLLEYYWIWWENLQRKIACS